MKNKRLIGLMVVFALVALVVILNSTVFTLQTVSLNWLTTQYKFKEETDTQIFSDISLPLGDSVFTLNKSKLITDLEKKQPFLNVVSVETIFPNKIVLHVAERTSLYALKLSSNNYAILDQQLKVLEFKEASLLPPKSEGRPVIVSVLNSSNINETDFSIGEKVQASNFATVLSSLTYSFMEGGTTLQSEELPLLISGTINSIQLDDATKNVDIQTSYGTNIKIVDVTVDLTKKLMLSFVRYFDMTESEKAMGANLTIFVSKNVETGYITANLIEN